MSIKAVDYNPHLALQSQLANSTEGPKINKHLCVFMGLPKGAGYEQTTTWATFKTAMGTFKLSKVTHYCYDTSDITFEPHDGPIEFSRFEVTKISNSDGTITRASSPMIFSRLQEVAVFFNKV